MRSPRESAKTLPPAFRQKQKRGIGLLIIAQEGWGPPDQRQNAMCPTDWMLIKSSTAENTWNTMH
eukprot:718647-Alexandrium_andersonii.AAC.1